MSDIPVPDRSGPAPSSNDPARVDDRLASLERELAELRGFAEFGREVGIELVRAGSDTSAMLRRCAELSVRHLDATLARIWTVDPTGEALEMRAGAGLSSQADGTPARIRFGESAIGRIAEGRRPLLLRPANDAPSSPDQPVATREGFGWFAGCPLIAEGRLVGVWGLDAHRPLSEATLRGMGSVAEQMALGIERREAEEALHRERERLHVTLECVGDAVISTDVAGRVTFLNSVACRLTGYALREARGLPVERVFRIVDEATREPIGDPARRALREGFIVELDNHAILIARDGSERSIDDSAAPIRDAAGKIVGAILIFRDIDERRRAERELERSEARKAGILASSLDAIISIDHRGHVLEWNPAAEKIFGIPAPEILGRSMAEAIIPPRMREAHRRGLAHYLATGEGPILGRRFEITAMRPGGEEFPVEMAITAIEGVVPPIFTGHLRDITDRKQAEVEAKQSLARFRTLADSITQLAWMAEADGHITWYNRRWHEYTGTTPEEMAGWGWQTVLDPATLPSVLARWKESIRTGQPFDMVFPIRGADGKSRPFLSRGVPLRDEEGRVVQWFGTNTDIAERIEMEESLRAAKEEAEQANHAKTQFLAVLSHELRTPLNPILLAATSMLDGPTPAEDFRPTMEMIRHNVNLQARLIDDLLDVMRIVQGKMPLHWGVADCHEVIRHAVQVCQSEIRSGRVRLALDLQADSHHVNADSARLQQVFWNLIKNAVKFSPDGGLLTIRTFNEGDEANRPLIVEVIDSGIGIDPRVLPTIFDPFQQGETSITRRFGGMGLGLAISRGVVEAHGGSIVAESAGPGRGTTFRVTLDSLPGQGGADAATSPPQGRDAGLDRPAHRSQLSILVVEDEEATRRLMGRLLRGHGHTVTISGTIEEASAEATRGRYDLIVSDIGLPDGSGLELMRRIVALKGPVPAIALTGYGMEEDIVRSREAGFTAHMTKPIDFTKLEAMIRQIVP